MRLPSSCLHFGLTQNPIMTLPNCKQTSQGNWLHQILFTAISFGHQTHDIFICKRNWKTINHMSKFITQSHKITIKHSELCGCNITKWGKVLQCTVFQAVQNCDHIAQVRDEQEKTFK
ncbi:hypothetical protein GOODEAATRI_013975 [Goodea atripinnis]|uniref:Uncharacterized protein n=1 Tax=Goodea atripinnis TaxID=208336 RepID=A0ABV0NUC2_9TELE